MGDMPTMEGILANESDDAPINSLQGALSAYEAFLEGKFEDISSSPDIVREVISTIEDVSTIQPNNWDVETPILTPNMWTEKGDLKYIQKIVGSLCISENAKWEPLFPKDLGTHSSLFLTQVNKLDNKTLISNVHGWLGESSKYGENIEKLFNDYPNARSDYVKNSLIIGNFPISNDKRPLGAPRKMRNGSGVQIVETNSGRIFMKIFSTEGSGKMNIHESTSFLFYDPRNPQNRNLSWKDIESQINNLFRVEKSK